MKVERMTQKQLISMARHDARPVVSMSIESANNIMLGCDPSHYICI